MQPRLIFDLNKAVDRSKLVQVQRTVTRKNGTTFLQNFWVNPSEVKSSDKVIGNQKVLDDYRDKQKKDAQKVNAAIFKFDKNKYDQLKNDREKAMEYAKQCGVQFAEKDKDGKPLSEPIRWMRCQMAVSKLSTTAPTITVPTLSLGTISQQSFDSMDKKQKIAELLKNNSRKELMDFARRSGIAWSEVDQQGNPLSEGVIWMRASMAIQKFIDGKTLLDISNISGNANATMQQISQQNAQPITSDQMEIPANATERQKNIINLLNSITDTSDLEMYKSIGIIAEDNDAKTFIKDKLKPRYEEWKKGHQPNSGGTKRASTDEEFGRGLSEELNNTFKGIPKKTLKKVFESFHRGFSLYSMLYPRMGLRTSSDYSKIGANSDEQDSSWTTEKNTVSGMITSATNYFSHYNTDGTTIINDSYDLDQCKKNYDSSKEGFLLLLKHISSKDTSLKAECDRISGIYDSMLSKVSYNHELLKQCLTRNYENITEEVKDYEERFSKMSAIYKILKGKGYSDTQIKVILDHNSYSNWNSLRVYDEQGNMMYDSAGNRVYIDLTQDPSWDSNWSYYAYSSDMRDVKKLANGESLVDARIEAMKTITEKDWLEIKALEMDLGGTEIFNTNTQTSVDLRDPSMKASDYSNISTYGGYELRPKQSETDVDFVLGNIYHILSSVDAKVHVARVIPSDAPISAANKQGNDYTGNFDFYMGLGGRMRTKLSWGSQTLTPAEMSKLTQEILDSEKVYSKKYIENARQYAEDNGDDQFNPTTSYWYTPSTTPGGIRKAKVQSVGIGKGSTFSELNGTPGGDITQDLIQSIASYCPQMKTTRYNTADKLRKHVDAVLSYTPTDFTPAVSASSTVSSNTLRKLREEVFTKVHCTLQTCDQKTTDYTQTRIKRGWDNGKMNSTGTARLYGSITADFTGKSYRVKNSVQMERMRAIAQKLGETPKDFFHGTGHSGAAGIVGVDGKFVCSGTNGTMLGKGVYLAEDAGKSAGYFGRWGSGYNREGCMILCKAVLGKEFTTSSFQQAPAGYDTTHMKAGTNTGRTVLRADEWCVRNPDMVAPEYIVDMTVKNR